MTNKTVLISGASVAGPALAFWLERFGYTPTVVERAPEPRPGGYAVDFRGASLKVLERMGLLEQVQAKATDLGEMTYVNEAGKPVAVMKSTVLSGELEVLRGDLVEILYDATRAKVEYLFDDAITTLRQDETGVDVTFERGGSRRFDLVIGADGLHSNVRRIAFGPESQYIHDLGYYNAVFTVPNHLGLDHTARFVNVPGKTAGTYSARDNTEAKALFYFASEPLKYDRHDVAAQQRILTDAFSGVGWEVPRLLSGIAESPDWYFDSVSQIKMPSYSIGRISLVGDAGYCASPLSGMGTSLAIVGAYVLAGELAATGGDHVLGFAAYEERMRGFVKACQKQGKDGGQWFVPGSKAFLKLRNLNFKLLPYLPWRKLIDELPLKVGNSIDLPDYAPNASAGLPQQPGARQR
ncbi:FAD-dependent monooxygenase [Kribbella sp. NPDC051718]|uniref:FAD-dependent monooxygenase n=1 Tax=Kribbella sp. NPDC051718 TaxID=3155168 RepID=UPI00343DA355